MDMNSTTPVAQPMAAGVSTRWLWVAIAVLVMCMAALASVWLLMPGQDAPRTVRQGGIVSSANPQRTTATPNADVAQGIQAPEHMESSSQLGMTPSQQSLAGVGMMMDGGRRSTSNVRVAHGG